MTQTQHDKIQAEITRLMADTTKVNEGIRWYEVVVIIASVVTIMTITKLYL